MRKSLPFKSLPLLLTLLVALAVAAFGFHPIEGIFAGPTLAPTGAPSLPASAPAAADLIPSLAPSPALSDTPAPTLSTTQPPTAQPTPASTPTLPAEHYLRAISGHHQYFPLGCETAAAKDWANYFGKDFNEFEFQYKLPLSDNPDYGFVGDVNSVWGQVPPYAYGVYAGPIADLLNAYGVPAKAYKGYTLAQLQAKVAQDKPIIAWVIGNVVGGVPTEYTDAEGRQTVVAAYEHVVIVTGYNADHIRYMNNGKFYDTPTGVFLNSWGVLGNMVVVDESTSRPKTHP